MVVPAGVPLGATALAVGVSEIAVGGSEVSEREGAVGGDGDNVRVAVPLQAATDSRHKSINRLMDERLFIVYISSIRVHNVPRTVCQITVDVLHMFLHHIRRAKLNK